MKYEKPAPEHRNKAREIGKDSAISATNFELPVSAVRSIDFEVRFASEPEKNLQPKCNCMKCQLLEKLKGGIVKFLTNGLHANKGIVILSAEKMPITPIFGLGTNKGDSNNGKIIN
jgi:hypothetical protein